MMQVIMSSSMGYQSLFYDLIIFITFKSCPGQSTFIMYPPCEIYYQQCFVVWSSFSEVIQQLLRK